MPLFVCQCGEKIFHQETSAPICVACRKEGRPQVRQPTPTWVPIIRRLRKPTDRGVGDTVARLLGRFGERFKAWSQKLGIPCGCTARQEEWNDRWPYKKTP